MGVEDYYLKYSITSSTLSKMLVAVRVGGTFYRVSTCLGMAATQH